MCLNLIEKPNVLQLKIEVIYLSFILLKNKIKIKKKKNSHASRFCFE